MLEILANRVATSVAALVLGACLAGPASAQIGVISTTDAGPTRQDGNVQVGQRIVTNADGHAHLIFVDGSAVTLGPSSTVTIDNYAYDASRKKGALTLNVEQGAVRFVGGAISKTNDVEIRTPSGKIAIRGGIAAVSVGSGETRASFLAGNAMRVTSGGITETATRAGSQISVAGNGAPSRATVLPAGQAGAFRALDRSPTSSPGSADQRYQTLAAGIPNLASLPRAPATAAANYNTAVLAQLPIQPTQIPQAGQPRAILAPIPTPTPTAVTPAAAPIALPAPNIPAPTPAPAPVAAKPGGNAALAGIMSSGSLMGSGSIINIRAVSPPGLSPSPPSPPTSLGR
jgi:FecR protein